MVEHLVYTERVGGSKPSPPSFDFRKSFSSSIFPFSTNEDEDDEEDDLQHVSSRGAPYLKGAAALAWVPELDEASMGMD